MSIRSPFALNRRSFLAGGSMLGLSAALPGRRVSDIAAAAVPPPTVPDAIWDKLAEQLSGPLLRKGDTAFARMAAPYNLAYAQTQPTGIALCFTAEDVKTAILWARDNAVPLVARCGGHSYGGYSTTTGLMVNVSSMRWANWPRGDLLTVGSGSRNQDLYVALRAQNRTATHGRCPTVGIAGFLLGGGIGFNARSFGVASDHLIDSDMVLADGSLHTISADSESDLFWACCGGGGGNFGINTSFTIRTFPAQRVNVFRYDWQGTAEEIVTTATVLMQSLTDAPDALGSRFSIRPPNRLAGGDKFTLDLIGQCYGHIDFIAGLMREVAHTCKLTHQELHTLDYWDGQDFLVEHDGPFRFHERSAFLQQRHSREALAEAVEQLGQWKGTRDPHHVADLRFFQTGGQMNRVNAKASAFVHRDSVWLMDIGLSWGAEDPQELIDQNIAWMNAFYESVSRFGNGHAYQNFIDPALKDYAAAYYGDNLKRLSEIKTKCDPDNVFRFAQSVPLATS
jgi:FAD/FMN-containing dehydrogenase